MTVKAFDGIVGFFFVILLEGNGFDAKEEVLFTPKVETGFADGGLVFVAEDFSAGSVFVEEFAAGTESAFVATEFKGFVEDGPVFVTTEFKDFAAGTVFVAADFAAGDVLVFVVAEGKGFAGDELVFVATELKGFAAGTVFVATEGKGFAGDVLVFVATEEKGFAGDV